MTRYRTIPYTSDDLRAIADNVEAVVSALGPEDGFLEDGDWRWGVAVDIFDPEGEGIVGQVKPVSDGWFGFYPKEATYE